MQLSIHWFPFSRPDQPKKETRVCNVASSESLNVKSDPKKTNHTGDRQQTVFGPDGALLTFWLNLALFKQAPK
jgi:hypothetical protein